MGRATLKYIDLVLCGKAKVEDFDKWRNAYFSNPLDCSSDEFWGCLPFVEWLGLTNSEIQKCGSEIRKWEGKESCISYIIMERKRAAT